MKQTLFDDLREWAVLRGDETGDYVAGMCREARIFRTEAIRGSDISGGSLDEVTSAISEIRTVPEVAQWMNYETGFPLTRRLPFETIAFEDSAIRGSRGIKCVLLRERAGSEGEFFFAAAVRKRIAQGNLQVFVGRFSAWPDSGSRQEVHAVRFFLRSDFHRQVLDDTHAEIHLKAAISASNGTDIGYAKMLSGFKDIGSGFASGHSGHDLAATWLLSAMETACIWLCQVNSPSRFILEERQVLHDKPRQTLAGPAAEFRPHYIPLYPNEIRRRMQTKVPPGSHASPAPHERRGHFHTFQHEKFEKSGLKGTRKWIEATFVGPKEAVIGHNRYIVRTDL